MTHRGPFQPRTFCDSVNGNATQILLISKTSIVVQICTVLWPLFLLETVFSAKMFLVNSRAVVPISFEMLKCRFAIVHTDHYITSKSHILLDCIFLFFSTLRVRLYYIRLFARRKSLAVSSRISMDFISLGAFFFFVYLISIDL